MMTELAQTSILVNPLASISQLESSGSQLDGIPVDLENSLRYAGSALTQAAGVLLDLSQDIIAQAIVTFARFWVGPEGGSLREFGIEDISAACIYLASKLSANPQTPRNVINVYAYLRCHPQGADVTSKDPDTYFVSEGDYLSQRARMMKNEAIILRVLGFETHISLPYTLCINYLQALEVFANTSGKDVAKRAFAHLNTALLNPQMLHLTHQPPQLATAAIYLAARETGVKLPEDDWWEVFDTDRETLGFLVAGMVSMGDFALAERQKWGSRGVPRTVEEVDAELERRQIVNGTT